MDSDAFSEDSGTSDSEVRQMNDPDRFINIEVLIILQSNSHHWLLTGVLLNFQSIDSDDTISDEEDSEIFNEGNTELYSDFFLKEPSSGIELFFQANY